MEIYKVDNKTSVIGLFLLLITVIVGGFLVGASIYLIKNVIYLVCIFPMIFGALAGALLLTAVQIGKVRIPVLAALCGIAMAVIVYGSYHYIDYHFARNEVYLEFVEELKEKYGSDSSRIANQAIDQNLIETTGFPGFIGYMIYKDQVGVQIGQTLSSTSNKDHLNPILTWLYWLIELLIIAVAASIIAVNATKKPFCPVHDRWYPKRKNFGGVPLAQAKDLFLLLQAGKFSNAGEMLKEAVPFPSVELYLQSCENCSDSPALLQLETNFFNNNGQRQVRKNLEASLSPLAQSQLIQGTRKSALDNEAATPNLG